jgi:hypothetical protein
MLLLGRIHMLLVVIRVTNLIDPGVAVVVREVKRRRTRRRIGAPALIRLDRGTRSLLLSNVSRHGVDICRGDFRELVGDGVTDSVAVSLESSGKTGETRGKKFSVIRSSGSVYRDKNPGGITGELWYGVAGGDLVVTAGETSVAVHTQKKKTKTQDIGRAQRVVAIAFRVVALNPSQNTMSLCTRQGSRRLKPGKLRRRVGEDVEYLVEAAGLRDTTWSPDVPRSGRLQLSDGRRHLEWARRSLFRWGTVSLNW